MTQTWRWAALAVWICGSGAVTFARCHVWLNDGALWADAVAKAPSKPRCVLNDGRTHELAGDLGYAEQAYRRVIGIALTDEARTAYVRRFSQAAAETNLAHLRMKDGKLASAMEILDGTLKAWPEFPYAHYNKAAILWVVGECQDARIEYDIALTGDPSLPLPKVPCTPATP